MHPQKVFFDMVSPVELLLADVALERLLVAMDVLVAREQVSTVRGVRAGWAAVALVGGGALWGGGGRGGRRAARLRRGLGRRRRRRHAVYFGLEPLQVLGDLVQHGVVLDERVGAAVVGHVVLPDEVEAHAARPRAPVRALRALENARVRVGAQPVLGHPGQEAHALAVDALEQLLRRVVGGYARARPLEAFFAR